MSNVHTKIISFLLILLYSELSYSQLTLEDIFLNRKYVAKTNLQFSFYNNESKYVRLEQNKIVVYNTNAQTINTIPLAKFWVNEYASLPNFKGIEVSNTDKFFLLKSNEEILYRRASTAEYYLLNQQNQITKISNYKISFPTFSFNDKLIAYVKENNLFYYNIETNIEQQITYDGKWNFIINGKSDWVYEEEFSLTNAFAWSVDNSKIIYLKFNETDVKEYTLPYYLGQNYPSSFTYKYPKVGEKNAVVSANYYDVKKKKNYKINLSNFSFEYIPRIYTANNMAYFMLLNRHQDSLQLVAYNFTTKQSKLLFTDVSTQFLYVPTYFSVLKDNSFIITSEQDGYNHLYHYNEEGKLIKQITKGDFEVNKVYLNDESENTIYYQSNELSVYNKNVFSLNYLTNEKILLTTENGTNNAVFSKDFKHYINTFSSTTIPPKISLCSINDTNKIVLENNQFLIDSLLPLLNPKRFLSTQLYDNNTTVQSFEIAPKSNIQNKKYPQLFYVYGGPNHQEVLNEWCMSSLQLWLYYMAQEGYNVTCIDTRGSGGKGARFKKSIYLSLGKQETEDLIAYAKYKAQLPNVDTSKIGVIGWSYGGYLSLLAIEQNNTPFKTAVAIAPITNWKFYDNIYTERYMRTPQENPDGYEKYNPSVLAKNLAGNLLIAHSTADDNVHFQHTTEFIKALNDANKDYQFYMYPDNDHSIGGSKNRYSLFSRITQFLKEKL